MSTRRLRVCSGHSFAKSQRVADAMAQRSNTLSTSSPVQPEHTNPAGGYMRSVIGFLTAMVMCAVPASAQTQTHLNDEHKLVKVAVGIGALAVGAAVAA